MKKIKTIFREARDKFDDSVNEFIKDKKIVDIKFTTDYAVDAALTIYNHFNAMIIYEDTD